MAWKFVRDYLEPAEQPRVEESFRRLAAVCCDERELSPPVGIDPSVTAKKPDRLLLLDTFESNTWIPAIAHGHGYRTRRAGYPDDRASIQTRAQLWIGCTQPLDALAVRFGDQAPRLPIHDTMQDSAPFSLAGDAAGLLKRSEPRFPFCFSRRGIRNDEDSPRSKALRTTYLVRALENFGPETVLVSDGVQGLAVLDGVRPFSPSGLRLRWSRIWNFQDLSRSQACRLSQTIVLA